MLRLPQYQKVMKIEPGKYFEIAYKLFRVNPDGTETLMHEVSAEEPDRAIFGMTMGFVEALDEAIEGQEKGFKFDFYAEPEKAFGPYTEEDIYTVPRENLLIDGKFDEEMFAPGELIPLRTPDGYVVDGLVVKLLPDPVVLDLNHPLAKDRVHYIGEVTEVRMPTQEELQPAHGCGGGCGGGCCSDGGCSDGSCGGGCCN